MFGNRTELRVFLYYSLFIARAKVHAHKTIRMQMPAAGTRQHWKSLNGKKPQPLFDVDTTGRGPWPDAKRQLYRENIL